MSQLFNLFLVFVIWVLMPMAMFATALGLVMLALVWVALTMFG